MARLLWLLVALAILQAGAPASVAEDIELGPAGSSRLDTAETPRNWRLSITSGFEASRGIFGNTNQSNAPFLVRLEYGRWSLAFSGSGLGVDGPSTVGRVKIGNASADFLDFVLANNTTVSITDIVRIEPDSSWGYGDSMLTLSRAWYVPDSWAPFIEVSAGIKIPTASTRKLHGTGKIDYVLQIDVAKSFGRLTPFATFGYRFNGSSYQPPILRLTPQAIAANVRIFNNATYAVPEPIPIRDTAQTSVGFNYRLSDSLFETAAGPAPLHGGLMYDWQENAVAGVPDTHELVPFLSVEISRNVQIGPYLIIGLSRPAPDFGFAGQVTVSY